MNMSDTPQRKKLKLVMIGNGMAGVRTLEELLKLATAVEQAAEGVVITDSQGVCEYVNPAFVEMTISSRWADRSRLSTAPKVSSAEPGGGP